jgi:hypothetical protein
MIAESGGPAAQVVPALDECEDRRAASARKRRPHRLPALRPWLRERTGIANVVPCGRDPAVGTLDMGDAELVDMAVEGIGDAARMPSDAKISCIQRAPDEASSRSAGRQGSTNPGTGAGFAPGTTLGSTRRASCDIAPWLVASPAQSGF